MWLRVTMPEKWLVNMAGRRYEGAVVLRSRWDERRRFRRFAERGLGPVPLLLIPGLRGLHGLRCIIVGQLQRRGRPLDSSMRMQA